MNKILFIGGPKDGKREGYTLRSGCTSFQVASMTQGGNPLALQAPLITQHIYTPHKFMSPTAGELVVAKHSTVPDLMEQLVKGYRYHRSPRHSLTSRRLVRIHNQLKQAAI